jgi:hypothetical protein
MSASNTQPENINLVAPYNFIFKIQRLPHVNYFVQSINIPSVSAGQVDLPTPFIRIPMAGDHLLYGLLTVTFRIDEDFQNYKEIYDWMKGIAFPDNFQEHADYQAAHNNVPSNPHAAFYSDGTLTALSNKKNPNIEVTFKNMWPSFLSDVNFNTQETTFNPLEATVSFAFQTFDLRKL